MLLAGAEAVGVPRPAVSPWCHALQLWEDDDDISAVVAICLSRGTGLGQGWPRGGRR